MTTVPPLVYQALSLKHGLLLYQKTGMKPNSRWTLSNMRQTVTRLTGKSFKPRDIDSMVQALNDYIEKQTGVKL